MKNILFYLIAITTGFTVQSQEYVHQVLILNEGYFDYSTNEIIEPVSIGSYNPVSGTYEEVLQLDGMRFGSDLIIENNVYYVAADTKIFKIDLNTHNILASANCEGVRNLVKVGARLFATRGEYMVNFDSYLHVYNVDDLSLEYSLDTQMGPKWATQNIVADGNRVYFAINNAYEWGNEKGIIGILNTDNLVYEDEYDLGPDATNPDNLVKSGDFLYTVNNKDWSGASISKLAIDLTQSETVNLSSVSTGCGTSALRDDKLIYQISMESSLNEFDLDMMNATGPISANFLNFYELKQNPVNGYLYASETDYYSFGKIHIYDNQNSEIALFETGISPGTVTFDIRWSAGLNQNETSFSVYPNPVQSTLHIMAASENEKIIRNMLGEEIYRFTGSSFETSEFPDGMYFIEHDNNSIRFIKN